jgi:hypothetical protein
MSDYGHPKFGWMAHVAKDDRLSDAHRLILMYIALQYVHGSDDWFCVRQATVAANLGKRRQTVGEALRRGRELGWLTLAVERLRGRGWHQADVYRMTHPEIGASGSTSSEKYVRGEDEIGTRRGQEYVRAEDEIGTFDARQNSASPAETPTLQGVDTGSSNTGLQIQGVDIDEASPLRSLFVAGDGLPEQPALPSPRYVQSTRPLDDHERCPKHKNPDPRCPICRAYARGRGEQL